MRHGPPGFSFLKGPGLNLFFLFFLVFFCLMVFHHLLCLSVAFPSCFFVFFTFFIGFPALSSPSLFVIGFTLFLRYSLFSIGYPCFSTCFPCSDFPNAFLVFHYHWFPRFSWVFPILIYFPQFRCFLLAFLALPLVLLHFHQLFTLFIVVVALLVLLVVVELLLLLLLLLLLTCGMMALK